MTNMAAARRSLVALTVVALALALSVGPALAQQTLKARLLGTWKAVSWETLRPNGDVVTIWMGPHPTGLLVYDPTGYMAVEIMADPRATFAQTPPTADEYKAALLGYYAYWGTYTVDEAANSVTHHVLGSERPPEVGRDYVRHVSLDGAKLTLVTPPYKAGASLPPERLERMQIPADEQLVNRLTFERLP